MTDIVSKSDVKNSENITSRKQWMKMCPTCGNSQFYSNKYKLQRAMENDLSCKSCAHIGQVVSDDTRKKLSDINRGRKMSDDFKKKCSIRMKNLPLEMRKRLNEPLERFRGQRKGSITPPYVKQKLRLAMINYIQSNKLNGGQMTPNYNHNACKYFDKLNNDNGWMLLHAQNGGEFYVKELGYWVDAYDKDKNIVVEYDEPRHYKLDGHLKEKDVVRLNEIKSHLRCRFLRYKEQTKELKEY
jgi:hypothetical protein